MQKVISAVKHPAEFPVWLLHRPLVDVLLEKTGTEYCELSFPLLTPTSLGNPRRLQIGITTCTIRDLLWSPVYLCRALGAEVQRQMSVRLGLSWKALFLAQKPLKRQARCLNKADLFQHHNILLNYTIKITLMAGRTLLSVHVFCTKTVFVASSTHWGKGHWNGILHSQRDSRKLLQKSGQLGGSWEIKGKHFKSNQSGRVILKKVHS